LQTQADFDITPADILAVQRLLQTQTSLLLTSEGREALQYLLAPILCKNQQQQAKFYAIYQNYLAQDLQPSKLLTNPKKITKKSTAFRWLYPTLGLLGLLFLVWKFGFKEKIPTTKIQFKRPIKQLHIGDTLRIKNTSLVDVSIPVVYEWTYLNKKNNQVEHQQKRVDFNFVIPKTEKQDYLKTIRLIGRDSLTQQVLGIDSVLLSIYCKNPPIINTINIGDTSLMAGTPLPFSAEVDGNNLSLNWQFGDGDTSTSLTPIHTYEKNGNYLIKLTAKDTSNRFGKCETSLQTYLNLNTKESIEKDMVAAAFALQKEPPKTVLQSKAWTYIILMLLLTAAGWSWLQWLMRPFLEKTPKDYFKTTLPASIKPLKELIQPTFLQFDIANRLRKRQAGRRQEMALTKTLQATVEKGGYSELHYQFKTKPTEYLALVELSGKHKDQKEFAQYLPNFFAQQDVLIQTFFYKNDFEKIWNARFPSGVSHSKLYELYPENRLLIFGNTNQLVTDWQQQKQLPETWEQLANQWKHQVICTNTPIPNQLFSTLPFDTALSFFPADLAGIAKAIDFLEEKTAPALGQATNWVNQTKNNIFGIQQFEAEHHTIFQSNHPEIYRWFLALTVYPAASLSTIIAIGKALKIAPTYDKLQAITPLANLQKNNFNKQLWVNNWERLTIVEERLARQGVATGKKRFVIYTKMVGYLICN